MQGTIARLSARLEGSIAKEAALKQRLQQLQASASRQLSASSTGMPSQGSVTPSQQAPQLHPQQEPRLQKLIASQPEQQQQQEQGFHPASASHAAGSRGSASTEGQTGRQEASSASEQELKDARMSLARAESELKDLRRSALPPAWLSSNWLLSMTCAHDFSVPYFHEVRSGFLGLTPALEGACASHHRGSSCETGSDDLMPLEDCCREACLKPLLTTDACKRWTIKQFIATQRFFQLHGMMGWPLLQSPKPGWRGPRGQGEGRSAAAADRRER